jgi:hypothetical protein
MTARDPIREKLREARFNLRKLEEIEKMEEFYPTLNAFLSAARSILYVASGELGWCTRKKIIELDSLPNRKQSVRNSINGLKIGQCQSHRKAPTHQ